MRARSREGMEVSAPELAAFLGIAFGTLKAWTLDGCPVVRGKGRAAFYNTKAVCQWREDRARWLHGHSATAGEPSDVVDLKRERARHEKAKRERTELELRQYRGELLEGDDVEHALQQVGAQFRQGVLALPARISVVLHDCKTIAQKRKAAEEICADVLRGIAQSTVELQERAAAASARSEETNQRRKQ